MAATATTPDTTPDLDSIVSAAAEQMAGDVLDGIRGLSPLVQAFQGFAEHDDPGIATASRVVLRRVELLASSLEKFNLAVSERSFHAAIGEQPVQV